MMTPLQYLEGAKIEALSSDLISQGYEVHSEKDQADPGFDLIAKKAGKTIAFQVKARSTLQESAAQLRQLREQARLRGFDEFRLVVVNPPIEKTVAFEGLETILYEYVANIFFPEIDRLAPHTRITSVHALSINLLTVTKDDIHVAGMGIAEVQMEWSGDERHNGIDIETDFPLHFNIVLNHNLEIKPDSADITIDTSSFSE